jgi:hypothetical protein
VAAGAAELVAAYADGASTCTSHHVATPPGPAAVIDREDGPPIGAKVVAAPGVAAGRVVAAAAGRVVAAAAGRVVAAAAGRVVAAAAGRVVAAAAGRVVAAAPAAGPTAHLTAVFTTQVNGRFAATSPTVTWPGE